MIIKPNNKNIRYTGRWNVSETEAESTANGNYFEFCFSGENAIIAFNTNNYRKPYPHIYVSVDGGARVSMPADNYVRISAEEGKHTVMVIMKGSAEHQHRWYSKRESMVSLMGIEADEFYELGEDNRLKIEFVGDSITEGIAIDMEEESYYACESSMVDWDDSTAGYAWLTAKALDFRPYIMGYGCLGVTKKGAGGVPVAPESYSFYSQDNEMPSIDADIVVINHGTNDRKGDKELFKSQYIKLLEVVRKRNSRAKIISLTPFSGCLAKEIEETVEKFNRENDENVYYIDSTGWIEPEPLHPTRSGHKIVSKHLVEIMRNKIL